MQLFMSCQITVVITAGVLKQHQLQPDPAAKCSQADQTRGGSRRGGFRRVCTGSAAAAYAGFKRVRVLCLAGFSRGSNGETWLEKVSFALDGPGSNLV